MILRAVTALEAMARTLEAEDMPAASENSRQAADARDSENDIVSDRDSNHEPEVEEAEANAELRDACREFASEVRGAAAAFGTSKSFVTRGFAACDALRSALRAEGTNVTDMQEKGAYQARAKQLDAGDYMLSDEALRRLQAAFGELTVDAFASGATALLPRFWSREAVDGAERVDAFAQAWGGERLLVHAPVGCLGEVIEKLEREKDAAAVVVCPHWTGAPWFEPLARLATDSLVLPTGSLRAVALRTGHVNSWKCVAFYVERRSVGS